MPHRIIINITISHSGNHVMIITSTHHPVGRCLSHFLVSQLCTFLVLNFEILDIHHLSSDLLLHLDVLNLFQLVNCLAAAGVAKGAADGTVEDRN